MAVHRRPPVEGPPLSLLTFRLDDWIPHSSPYWAWLMARFEWCRDHPNDFSLGGDALDMLRARAAYRAGALAGVCCSLFLWLSAIIIVRKLFGD